MTIASSLLLLLASGAADAAALTAAEVARHDQADDCWMIIDGVVYDVTPWIAAHPGGDQIVRGCGKDASWFFHNRDPQGGHSDGAAAVLEGFALGPLGVDAPGAAALDMIHPHDVRLEGARAGMLPTAGTGPARSVVLRVGHNFAAESDIISQVGYSFGRVDLLLSDARQLGLGGLEVRARPFWAHNGAPVSLTAVAGGGFASSLDMPAFYGQLIPEAELARRRLKARAVGTVANAVDGGVAGAVGAGVSFRPIPIHSVFAEVNVPLAAPDGLAWAAGARLFTRSHCFAVYASSMVSASAWSLTSGADGFTVGASMERAFRL